MAASTPGTRAAPVRALVLAAVILLHLLLIAVLLLNHEAGQRAEANRTPFVVTLLLDNKPPAPPQPAASTQAPARPSPPNDASFAPRPEPPTPRPPVSAPAPAAPAPTLAGQDLAAAQDDTVFNLDTGAGAGGPGFTPPHWVHKVTDEEFFPLLDEELLQGRLEVELQMQCVIALDAHMQCKVLKEWPVYPGIRRAVRQATPLLRMAPGKRFGRPIANQQVQFLWRIQIDRPSFSR
ncbi:MAG: hypothetical protein WC803_04675 [Sphingomonas sp.]|jgi:hypothetical protein